MPHDLERLLREAGLRVTKPRLAVLETLAASPHADTTSVISGVRGHLDSVSHQAVYDCLNVLTEAGLVRKFQPAGSVARYEIWRGDNHHHLVCTDCGSIVDVPCATGRRPCLTASESHGYEIELAEVTYWGTCPTCSADKPVPAGATAAPSRPPHVHQP